MGEAIIVKGQFGLIRFKPLLKPDYTLHVEIKAGIDPTKTTKKKRKSRTIKKDILNIAEMQGAEAALLKLYELRKEGKVGMRHFYNLRKILLEMMEEVGG